MATKENGTTSWKHIGLNGHSVGTFACSEGGVQWKSAMYGRGDDAGGGTVSTRNVPKAALEGALWSVFGKSGHLRVKTTGGENNKLAHELRFDGFSASKSPPCVCFGLGWLVAQSQHGMTEPFCLFAQLPPPPPISCR